MAQPYIKSPKHSTHRLTAFRGFPKLGVPFWGPENRDYSILGSILGSPYFGQLPFRVEGLGFSAQASTPQLIMKCTKLKAIRLYAVTQDMSHQRDPKLEA